MKSLFNVLRDIIFLIVFFFAYTPKASAQSYVIIPSNGPFSGGNVVLVTNATPNIGNGSDITTVSVGGTGAIITGQGTRWVSFISPTTGVAGVKDVVIQSTSRGGMTLTNSYVYNPSGFIGPNWIEVSGLPAARHDLAAGVLNGALYAFGGIDSNFTIRANMYKYNGTNWAEVSGMPTPRNALASEVLNGSLYAIGGEAYGQIPQTNVYQYNGTNWAEVAGLPTTREYSAAGVLNGSIYVVGGSGTTNVYSFNGTNWIEVAGLPVSRRRLTVEGLNGSLYAVGGVDNGWNIKTNVYRYNGTNWAEVAGIPVSQYNFSAGVLNGALYIFGGLDIGSNPNRNMYRYDGNIWAEMASLPRNSRFLAGGALNGSIYAIGGDDYNGNVLTNVYRYSGGPTLDSGLTPFSGSYTGGYQVVIIGTNLSNGSDITNVTVCGVAASSILSQSSTQVTVIVGVTTSGVSGVVRVYSASYGVTVKSNAFTYTKPEIGVRGTNGAILANGANASLAGGTDFGHLVAGASFTNTFAITNAGNESLIISGWSKNGVGSAQFVISGMPSVVAPFSAGQFQVVFSSLIAGTFNSSILFTNNATNYTVNLGGECAALSVTNGPFSGGNVITITNGPLGNGLDITNVLVGGVAAIISGQGTDWVSIIMPATGSSGIKDIVVQSVSIGTTRLANAYTVNPAGQISEISEDWSQWQEVAGLPAARDELTAGVLNGALYAIGGYNGSAKTNMYRYDGQAWSSVAGLPVAHYGHAVGVLNGVMYAVGGYSSGVQTNLYRYNGSVWSEVSGLPVARGYLAAGVMNGGLYTVGGYNAGVRTNAFRYDGTNWTEVAGLPAARDGLAAGVLNGSLFAFGGEDSGSNPQTNAYRYNGTNWLEIAGLPAPRYGLAAEVLNGSLYAIGGVDSNWIPQTNVFRFNGTNWTEVAGLPAAREYLAAGVLKGGIYAIGGFDGVTVTTNVYRYPRSYISGSGVSPSSGSYTGGYQVVIVGSDLGNGSDITNVMICGSSVRSIISQTATQVVVIAGLGAGAGNVQVFSTSFGVTVKSNVFTYNGPGIIILSPAGASLVNGGSSSLVNGSDFGHLVSAVTLTNTFVITNAGNEALTISGWKMFGSGASRFAISGIPSMVAPTSAVPFQVAFSSSVAGVFNGSLLVTNNVTNYVVNLHGSVAALSSAAGNFSGGNSITIIDGALGDGSDITNVLVGGVAATITGQGTDWVVITLPMGVATGPKDIIIQSASLGNVTLAAAYTYNPSISVLVGQYGTVTPSGTVDVAYGASTSFVVKADAYYHIVRLLTNGSSMGGETNQVVYTSLWNSVTTTGVLEIAFAADLTANTSTPIWWLAQYGWTNNFDVAATNDTDSDGMQNWQEWLAGCDPTNPASQFRFESAMGRSEGCVVRWPSISNRYYDLTRSMDLMAGSNAFTVLPTACNMPATPPQNVYTDAVVGIGPFFYKIGVHETNLANGSYLVVDLSSGSSASNYPVSYLEGIPAGGWTDEYKTTKMVFRCIPSGTFLMGSPTNELGRFSEEVQQQVTITRPFYMGLFHVTQKQWERVMGTWPSWYNNVTCRDARPVEQVTYNAIRGASAGTNWPANSAVDSDSFVGRLRLRTGMDFDLPTEAQWEYSGRGGATTALNSGNNLTGVDSCPNVAEVGRYWYNGGNSNAQSVNTSGGTAKAGSYLPNAWGLYDFHGNVFEWCLDWYSAYSSTTSDPKGADFGVKRVFRGGSWYFHANICRIAFRSNEYPSTVNGSIGLRLAIRLGQ